MKALYRRYRPKKLSEVVAQKQVTEPLISSLEKGELGHAYLFVGPRGCGKTSVARILAHEINKFEYELEDSYLDIIEIDAASNTGVDNIRELRERAVVAPVEGKYKVYIIDEVHMLSKSAFNALLKTLEEPPEHVIFIMATTEKHKVPATIISRCQVFQFRTAEEIEMITYLKKIIEEEKINIEDEALKILYERGGGSFRDTLSLLDQIASIQKDKITAASVREMLGLPTDEIITKLFDAYKAQDLNALKTLLNEVRNNNIEPKFLAEELIRNAVESLDPQLLSIVEPLTKVSTSTFPETQLLISLMTPSMSPVATTIMSQTVAVSAPRPAAPITQATPAPTAKPEPTPAPAPATPATSAPKAAPKPTAPKATEKPAEQAVSEVTESTVIVEKITSIEDPAQAWSRILTHLKENAPTIAAIVEGAGYEFVEQTLTIYSGTPFKMKQIEKKRNKICEILPTNIELIISDQNYQSNETMANIAALMGGGEEVTVDE